MLVHKLSIISRYSNIYAMRELQKYEIGYAEFGILMYLIAHNNVTQESIAQYYMIDKGAIARTVQKLEAKDYLIRTVNKENQREKLVSLTELGLSITNEMKSIQKKWEDILLTGITKEEQNLLDQSVRKISQNAINYMNRED